MSTFTDYAIREIGVLQGDEISEAMDVNAVFSKGKEQQVAAYSTGAAQGANSDAFLWISIDAPVIPKKGAVLHSELLDFDEHIEFTSTQVLGMNNVFPSHEVGWGSVDGSPPLPVKWEKTRTTVLNTLGGAGGQARSVNDAGQVVGWAHTAGGQRHAFLWTLGAVNGVKSNPQMLDLSTLGGDESEAHRINNKGQVVGWAQTANGEVHAFLWLPIADYGLP